MRFLYLVKENEAEVEYRQKVNAIRAKTYAPLLGYDADGEAVFDCRDPVESQKVRAMGAEHGLAVFALSGTNNPLIMDER